MKKRYIYFLTICFLCAGCANPAPFNITNRNSKLLIFPPAQYTNILLVNNQLVAIASNTVRNEPGRDKPEYAFEGDSNLQLLNFPEDTTCHNKTEYWGFETLPNGQVGMIKDCIGALSSTTNPLGDYRYLFAFDWEIDEIKKIVDGPLSERRSAGGYAWNPQMTLGVQEMGVGSTRGTLYWVSPKGITEMDIEIENNNLSWNLKDGFTNPEKKCSGMANRPAWTPDGKIISFFASSQPIKNDCQTHITYREGLYFMNPEELNPIMILEGIYDPITPVWSPDSKKIAFLGCYDTQVQCGIWMYSQSDGLTWITSGRFIDIIWKSNSSIVALRCKQENEICYGSPTEVWEYSFSPLGNE